MGPTVLDERGAFAVENPEVAEVMEIASGDHLDHGEVIGTDYEKAIQLRMALRTDIKRGTPHYACSLCGVSYRRRRLMQGVTTASRKAPGTCR